MESPITHRLPALTGLLSLQRAEASMKPQKARSTLAGEERNYSWLIELTNRKRARAGGVLDGIEVLGGVGCSVASDGRVK